MQVSLPFAPAFGKAMLLLALGVAAWPAGSAARTGASAPDSISTLIPAPVLERSEQGNFTLTANTPVIVASSDPDSRRIAQYFIARLARARGAPLKIRAVTSKLPSIVFALDPTAAAEGEEGYVLDVNGDGVRVSARYPHGLFNGAISLLQLATGDNARPAPLRIPARHIEDRPRFSWRGLMLDSARHRQTPAEIRQFIDAMALHKLNVLQWHLTDDQGWRLQINKYPRLTEVGAWRIPAGAAGVDAKTGKPVRYGGFYTQDQVRELVRYAADRYITIVPEIDMPGHAQAAIAAYPEFGTVPAPAVSHDWGVHSYLFNNEDKTFVFLEDVLTEVMALFPSQYIHIGGDETVKDQWKASPRVQQRMRELGVRDEVAMQAYLTARMQRFLAAHGRRLIGWDEILEGGLPADAAVMSWRGVDGALVATAQGHDSVLSPWPTLYFDNRQGAGAQEPPGRLKTISTEDVYRFDPLPATMSPEQAKHVIGVQANIWTEHIRTAERVQWMTFPRAAAIAEMGWSPPEKRDWSDFQRRLPALYARYDALGIGHAERSYTDPASSAQNALAITRSDSRLPAGSQRRSSAQLNLCSENIALGLEDDAPAVGPRAIFHLDIQNPCWLFEQADLDRVDRVVAAVGSVPFNFQIGDAAAKIQFAKPDTAAGELLVLLDRCDGEILARLPMAPAAKNTAITILPAASLRKRSGRHDLCFRFAQHGLDPMYALDWVQLMPASKRAGTR
jgi:hexosaminidase